MISINCWRVHKLALFFLLYIFTSFRTDAQDSLKNESLLPVFHDSNWYFMDTAGILQFDNATYESISFTSQANIFQVKKKGKYGLLAYGTDTLIPINCDTILDTFRDFIYRAGEKWYIREGSNARVSTLNADNVVFWKDDIFIYSGNKKGILLNNSNGDLIVVTPQYDALMPYYDYYLTYKGGKFGLINRQGEMVVDNIAAKIDIDIYKIISVLQNYKWYILPDGRMVDPGPDGEAVFYSEKFWKIEYKNRKTEFYHSLNTSPLLIGHDDYFLLNPTFFAFRSGDKSGLADISGKIWIDPKFEFIGHVRDSIFFYKEKDLLGLLSSNGIKLTEAIYTDIEKGNFGFSRYLKVNINGSYGVIDEKGKTLVPTLYEEVMVDQQAFITFKSGKFGLYYEDGKEIAKPVYDDFQIINDPSSRQNFSRSSPDYDLYRLWKGEQNDIYNRNGKLNERSCSKYVIANNTVKCYCDVGLEVIYLNDSGDLQEKIWYKDILFLRTKDTITNALKFRTQLGSRISVLEADQATGKFTMRLTKKPGYGFKPKFNQVYETKYGGCFLGKLNADTLDFSIIGFPLLADSYDLYFSSGNLYSKDSIVSSDLYMINNGSRATAYDYAFSKNKSIDFFTPEIFDKKIIYIEPPKDDMQRFYSGGEMKLLPNGKSNLHLWDLFVRYNQHGNIWFNGENSVAEFMSEESKIVFKGGNWKVQHGTRNHIEDRRERVFDGTQLFQEFENDERYHSHIYSQDGKKYGLTGRFAENHIEDIYDTLYRIRWNFTDYLGGKIASAKQVYYDANLETELNSFTKPSSFIDSFAVIHNHRLNGIINYKEEWVIDSTMKKAENLGEGVFSVRYFYGGNKLINSNKTVLDSNFISSKRFGRNLVLMKKSGYGCMDNNGRYIIAPEFDTLISMSDGFVFAKKKMIKSIYSSGGIFIRDLLPEEKFKNGWIIRKKSKKKFILDNMNKSFELTSSSEPKIIGNLILAKKGKDYLYFDFNGEQLFSVNTSAHQEFSNGKQAIKNKKEWIILDSALKEIHICEADEIIDFGDWLKIIKADKSYIVNANGKRIELENNVLPVRKSSEGIIVCKSKLGYFFCDIEGNRINEEYYDGARDFENGYAAVMKNDYWGFINREGVQKIDFLFVTVSDFSGGKFFATRKALYGLYNLKGETILPPIFEELRYTPKGIFIKKEKTSGYYISDKKIIWPKKN